MLNLELALMETFVRIERADRRARLLATTAQLPPAGPWFRRPRVLPLPGPVEVRHPASGAQTTAF